MSEQQMNDLLPIIVTALLMLYLYMLYKLYRGES